MSPVPGPDGAMGAIEAALETLDTTINAGFRRGHPLHVVVVSASDDSTPSADTVAFTAWLEALSSDVTFSARVPATASTYLDLAATVGGLTSDLDTESGPFFDSVGLLASGLTRTFPLSAVPVGGTLEVEVEVASPVGALVTFEEGVDFTWDAIDNAITFAEYVPELGAEVRVRYQPAP